jgi:hypothetical protein
MLKFVAAAALCVASFAVPVLPTQAKPLLSDAETKCFVFPLFKKECWHVGAEKAAAAPAAAVATTVAAKDAAREIKLPLIWSCARAPAGSGHLLDC